MEIIRIRLINSWDDEGCQEAPVEILKELRNFKSSESGRIIDVDALNLEEIHVNLEDLEEANHLIFENSKESFEKNFKTLFIGGDHSISYPIIRAFEKIEENPLLIVFDAHADCLSGEDIVNNIKGKQDQASNSSSSLMDLRVNKNKNNTPNNRNWLRKLVEQSFDPTKVILISGRNFGDDEIKFFKRNEITLIKMDILQEDIHEVCDLIMERARSSGGFYISIDIDSIDPAFAPGINNPEPGGLSSRDLIYFIKRLVMLDNFRGADIVEINPKKDINRITIKLGAKLLGEML